MTTYFLSVNTDSVAFNQNQFLQFIAQNRKIDEWLTPYRGVFLLKSERPLQEVKDGISAFLDASSFFIAEVEPLKCGGALSNEVWDWFNREFMSEEDVERVRVGREQKRVEQERIAGSKEKPA